MNSFYSLKAGDDEYYNTTEDLQKAFDKHTITITADQFKRQKEVIDMFDELPNPGVKVINVYGTHSDVYVQLTYDESPKKYTSQDKYYFPKESKYIKGDGTVCSTSALVGPIKWKIENDKKLENSKPVRFVEMCSNNSLTKNVNNVKAENGELTFEESGYNGIECECTYEQNYD